MIGEVEFVVAPFALDEMRGEHKDAPSALLDASEDVLDDRLSRDEVALMVTHSQAVAAFELGKKLRFDPVAVSFGLYDTNAWKHKPFQVF